MKSLIYLISWQDPISRQILASWKINKSEDARVFIYTMQGCKSQAWQIGPAGRARISAGPGRAVQAQNFCVPIEGRKKQFKISLIIYNKTFEVKSGHIGVKFRKSLKLVEFLDKMKLFSYAFQKTRSNKSQIFQILV